MRKKTTLYIILSLLILSFHLHSVEIMKTKDIKVGMEGVGKTIFKGTKAETFDFKVLGIIENFAPKKDLIIVELNSPYLNEGGIVSGMSGSPAYIDGKLIGAVAYGFAYSKRPIGGITPIEDILETIEYNTPSYTIDVSTIKVEFDKKNVSYIAELIQSEILKILNPRPTQSFSPLRLRGSCRGFKPSSFSYFPGLKPMFTFASDVNISTPEETNRNNKKIDSPLTIASKDLLKISPADAVAVSLIKGDFEISASGTVTHVEDNNIYIFGHPFFNLGTVDFPLHKAEVISFVPSFNEPFRLVSTKQMVGRVIQDRFSAVQGELGKIPYMIPMKIFLKNRNQSFNIEMANHPLITPMLSALSVFNIFNSQYQQAGFQSIKVDGKIFIEGEKNIIINDLFSGTNSFVDFSNLFLVITYFLMNNNEKNIKIQKVDFEFSGSENLRRANLENVLIEKNAYLPGEIMNISVFLRNEKGRAYSETFSIPAPNLKAKSEFYLLIADNEEMGQFDSKNVRSNFFPIKLSFLIRAINNLRKNNRLYLKLMTSEPGLFVKGHEYPNVPFTLQNIFKYNTTSLQGMYPNEQSTIKYSTIREYQMEFPTVVRGKKLFKLKIKERSNDQ